MRKFNLITYDAHEITTYEWKDVVNPIAAVHVIHSSTRSGIDYDDFAKEMNKKGIIVISSDLRGHGKSNSIKSSNYGYFSNKQGWRKLIDDLKTVNNYINKTWNELPIFMMGDYFGTILLKTYLIKYSESIYGAIFLNPFEIKQYKAIYKKMKLNIVSLIKGDKFRSKRLINNLFGQPISKKFIWEANEDEFMIDINEKKYSDCAAFSVGALSDMFNGIIFNSAANNIKHIRKELPIILITSQNDAYCDYGVMCSDLKYNLVTKGFDVEMKVYNYRDQKLSYYPDREKVYQDIFAFIKNNLNSL